MIEPSDGTIYKERQSVIEKDQSKVDDAVRIPTLPLQGEVNANDDKESQENNSKENGKVSPVKRGRKGKKSKNQSQVPKDLRRASLLGNPALAQEAREKNKSVVDQRSVAMAAIDEFQQKQELADEEEKARQERLAKQLKEVKKQNQQAEERKDAELMSNAISDLERSLMQSRSSIEISKERDSSLNEKRMGLKGKRGVNSGPRSGADNRGGAGGFPSSSMIKSSSDRVNLNFSSQVVDSALKLDLKKQSSVIEHAGVYSNDFAQDKPSMINSASTLSGLRKSNPYEQLQNQLNHTSNPVSPERDNSRPQLLLQKKQQIEAQGKFQMNIKRQNTVKRTFNYKQAIQTPNEDQFSFTKIDENLKTDYLETKMREILVEQVMPIVTLSKKNLIYNAQKNQQLDELKEFTQELCTKLEETRSELSNLSTVKQTVKANMESYMRHVVVCTTNHDAVTEQMDTLKDTAEGFDGRLREMRSFLTIKDKKVDELTEHVAHCREDLSKCSIRLSKQMSKEFKDRDDKILYTNRQVRTMDSIIQGQRQFLDNLSAQVMRFQIHQELQDQKIERIIDKNLSEMNHRIDDIWKESTRQTSWYSDTNMKFDKAMDRLEPLHERMRVLEAYTQRGVPLLTQLQISDALQEFLCLQDQIRLIEYDNNKMEQLTKALLSADEIVQPAEEESDAQIDKENSDDSGLEEYPSTTHMDTKRKHQENMKAETEKTKQEMAANRMLHARLQALLQLMAETKQGCIRFKWGRDWNIRDFDSVEKAQNLHGVPYKMYLSNKSNLLNGMLAKETQQDLMDKYFLEAQRKRHMEEQNLEKLNSKESETKSQPQLTNRTQRNIQKTTDFRNQARLSIPSEKGLDDDQGRNDQGLLEPPELSDQQQIYSKKCTLQGQDQNELIESEEIASSMDKDLSSLSQTQQFNLLNYYNPKFDCGFQGGQPMQTSFGQANNAHVTGSGVGKVFREVTIIRTGGGTNAAGKRGNKMARRQTMIGNRRKLKLLEQKKLYISQATKDAAATIQEQFTGESSVEGEQDQSSLMKNLEFRQSHYSMDEANMPIPETTMNTEQDQDGTYPANQTSMVVQASDEVAAAEAQQVGGAKRQKSQDMNSSSSVQAITGRDETGSLKTVNTELKSTQRRRGPPMIPSEELTKLKNMIGVAQKMMEGHIKEFDQYKNAVSQEKIEVGVKFKSVEKELKKMTEAQTKLTSKLEKNKLQVVEIENDLSERVKQAEDFSARNLRDMRRIYDETTNDNKSFKKYIISEYVEFFKSKKKIRQEQAIQAAETEKKISEFLGMLSRYDHNISTLNTCLPILVEVCSLVSKFSHTDIKARSLLNQTLKLSTLPNSGYLCVDKTNKAVGERAPSAKSTASISQQRQMMASKVGLHSNKPMSEQLVQGGSLCASQIPHRNTILTTDEYLAIIQELISLCQKKFINHKVIKAPKKYFDEAVIHLRNGGSLTNVTSLEDIKVITPLRLDEQSSVSRSNNFEMLYPNASRMTPADPLMQPMPIDQQNMASTLQIGSNRHLKTGQTHERQSPWTANKQHHNSRPGTTEKTILSETEKQIRFIENIRNESNEKLKKSMVENKPGAIYLKSKNQLLNQQAQSRSKPSVVIKKGIAISRNPKLNSIKSMYSTADAFKKPTSQIKVTKIDSYSNIGSGGDKDARTRNQIVDEAYKSYQTSSDFSRASINFSRVYGDKGIGEDPFASAANNNQVKLNISGQKSTIDVRASLVSRNMRQNCSSTSSVGSKQSIRKSFVSKDSQVKLNKIKHCSRTSSEKVILPLIKDNQESLNTVKSLNSDILSVQQTETDLIASPDFRDRDRSNESRGSLRRIKKQSPTGSTALLSKRESQSVMNSIEKKHSIAISMQVNRYSEVGEPIIDSRLKQEKDLK